MINMIYLTISVSFVWLIILAIILSTKADATSRATDEIVKQFEPEAEAGRVVEYKDQHGELQFGTLLNSLRKSDKYVIMSRVVYEKRVVRLCVDRKNLVRIMSKEFSELP